MLRIGAIFIAVCMVLIAASVGAVLFLGFKLDLRTRGAHRAWRAGGDGALQYVNSRLTDRRTARRPDRRSVARHRRPVAPDGRNVAPARRRRNPGRQGGQPRARRGRSARRRDRRTRRAGAPDRRDGRGPCRCLADGRRARRERCLAELPKAAGDAAAPDGALDLTERDAVTGPPPFQGLWRDDIAELIAKRPTATASISICSRSSRCRSARCASTRRCRGCAPKPARSCRPPTSSRSPKASG